MALALCLVSAGCVFAQITETKTLTYSIIDGDPILESSENNLTLTIVPQTVTTYNCSGQEEEKFIQYQILIYTKFLGMVAPLCDHTISGETLCHLKVLAAKTKESMNSNGKEGLVIDNGELGAGAFRISVSEMKPIMMKRGWYMTLYTGHVNASSTGYYTFNRKVTAEFVDALANIAIK